MKLVKFIHCLRRMVRHIYNIRSNLQIVGSIYEESKGLLGMAEKNGKCLKKEK